MTINYWQTFNEGSYYHIYNRAIGYDLLFLNYGNYEFFLKKYQEYVSPYVDTFAFCLMSNHFHFIIRPKQVNDVFVESVKRENSIMSRKFIEQLSDTYKSIDNCCYDDFLVDQFKRLFNSYSAAFNKQHKRTGSLFQRKFKRIELKTVSRLIQAICYVHHNPIHHDASPFYEYWRFSSYKIYISESPTLLSRTEGLALFKNINFNLSDSGNSNDLKLIFSQFHQNFHLSWIKKQVWEELDEIE